MDGMKLDDIAELTKSLPLKELLAFIAAKELTKDLRKDAYSYIKQRVKELLDESKYGFVPKPEEAKAIQSISKSDIYSRLKDCVGKKHWSLPLIKTGLYIAELKGKDRQDIISRIKQDILNRHGDRGLKVMHLGDTGMIRDYVAYLSNLKLERNLSVSETGERLDDMIRDWEKITIFVKHDDLEKEISDKIRRFFSEKHEVFFVFSTGSANEIAARTIAQLNNSDEIRKNNYIFRTHSDPYTEEKGQRYRWMFELLKTYNQ